jgi:spore maturation protein CgeB
MGLRIAFFGSSLVSAYWNGAATYYRGIVRAMHALGHHVTFYEPDALERQAHRDMDDPFWARVVVYPAEHEGLERALEDARSADVVVKASGVGVFDDELEAAVADMAGAGRLAVFWDVDAPATLARLSANAADPLRGLIPRFDLVLTYGGGPRVCEGYRSFGARACVPIHNAVDPTTHHPARPDARFAGDVGFLGNRLPDREARVDALFFAAAPLLPEHGLVLGGSGWGDRPLPPNVRYLGHVYTRDHNAFNSSVSMVLNVSRDSMARTGHSPATRVFEAAGAGACLVTDPWEGLEAFLEPDREVLVASSAQELAEQVRSLSPRKRQRVGSAARRRVLAEHTYAHRAVELEHALGV